MEAGTPPRYAASSPHAVTNFRAYLPNSSAHIVGGECDGAQSLDHGGTPSLFSQGSARPWKPGSKPGRDGGLKLGESAVVRPCTQGDHAASSIRVQTNSGLLTSNQRPTASKEGTARNITTSCSSSPSQGRRCTSVAQRRSVRHCMGDLKAVQGRRGWATARRAVVEAAFWPRAGGEAPKRAPRAFAQAGQFSRPAPGVVRGSACQAAIASLVNQTVKLPRWRGGARGLAL